MHAQLSYMKKGYNLGAWPQGYKTFHAHEMSMKLLQLIKNKILKNKDFSALKLSDTAFILIINVKMPTIVDILKFMSMINFMLI